MDTEEVGQCQWRHFHTFLVGALLEYCEMFTALSNTVPSCSPRGLGHPRRAADLSPGPAPGIMIVNITVNMLPGHWTLDTGG